MLLPDPRGYRVAVVADAIVNEDAAGYDVAALLDAAAFGMIVPPPANFALPRIASTIEYLVDDLEDYRRQVYRVVVIGSSSLPQFGTWLSLVDAELVRRGAPAYERFDVRGTCAADLEVFLAASQPAALA